MIGSNSLTATVQIHQLPKVQTTLPENFHVTNQFQQCKTPSGSSVLEIAKPTLKAVGFQTSMVVPTKSTLAGDFSKDSDHDSEYSPNSENVLDIERIEVILQI